MDQELADTAAYVPGGRYVCTHQMAEFSASNDVIAAILEVKIRTPSVDAYFILTGQSCQISSLPKYKKAMLSLRAPRDAVVNIDTYRILKRHCVVSLPQRVLPKKLIKIRSPRWDLEIAADSNPQRAGP